MYNLIVMGSGRSGTSMATALFKHSGYFFGESMLDAGPANPYGYYEDSALNSLNFQLIARMLFLRPSSRVPGLVRPVHQDFSSAWLAAPPVLFPRKPSPVLEESMRRYAAHTPFCYKDPRFNVTLPVWRPYLPKTTRFLVVFREPDRTVDSILLTAARDFDPPLPITPEWAYLHWARNYQRILDRFADDENWLFVDYNSIIEHRALPAIRAFSQAEIDASELNPSVRLSNLTQKFTHLKEARRCHQVYGRLRERSAHDLARWTGRGVSLAVPGLASPTVP